MSAEDDLVYAFYSEIIAPLGEKLEAELPRLDEEGVDAFFEFIDQLKDEAFESAIDDLGMEEFSKIKPRIQYQLITVLILGFNAALPADYYLALAMTHLNEGKTFCVTVIGRNKIPGYKDILTSHIIPTIEAEKHEDLGVENFKVVRLVYRNEEGEMVRIDI